MNRQDNINEIAKHISGNQLKELTQKFGELFVKDIDECSSVEIFNPIIMIYMASTPALILRILYNNHPEEYKKEFSEFAEKFIDILVKKCRFVVELLESGELECAE